MRRFHGPVAEGDFGVVDALDAKHLDTPDRTDHIENCIYRSHFVQMQFIGCDAVDRAFDRRDRLECRVR